MPKTLRNILLRDKMLMSRLGLSIGSFLWAAQLALPASLFPTPEQIAAGAGRVTYSYMAAIGPEWVWALLFAIHACFAFYTLFSGVRNTVTLACDGFLGCLLWTTATVACYASHWPRGVPFFEALIQYPTPAAMSADIVMAGYAWWHMIRFWAEEETHRACFPSGQETKIGE